MERALIVVGLGFTGDAIARRAAADGWQVQVLVRTPASPVEGVRQVSFAAASEKLALATHLVVTAPPGEDGDPVLAVHGPALAAAPLRWVGYLSTVGVYGDRGGAAVDETTPPAPNQPRSLRRRAAERAWEAFAARAAVDLFRCGGIYGPGRSVLDDLRDGTARRVIRPGHVFTRIHRDDVARAVLAAAGAPPPAGVRVLNLVDDEPAESATVMEGAAAMLGVPPPPPVPFDEAARTMSPMARSFWAERRRVGNARTKAALGLEWAYPTWRDGLAAILAEENR